MRLPRILLVFAALAAQAPAHAQDLLQVYRDAKSYDAQYASARSALQAGLEKLPQGRALILPSVGLTANVTSTRIDTVPHNLSTAPAILRDAHSLGYTVSFSQPIYRPQNLIQYGQAEYQVRQAEATFGQAAQDLIVRTAQAYFDVLASQDSLAL